MTNQPDPIRARLTAHDPLQRHPHTHPAEPPAQLLEQIMNTPTIPSTTGDPSTGAATVSSDTGRRRRRNWTIGGATAGVAAAITAALTLGGGGSAPLTTMELDLGQNDALASCLPVSADILDDMAIAFGGTVTEVEGETITLDVSTWYVGGDTDQVVLTAPAGMEALIGGIAFEPGQAYLVSATAEGTVNYCGYTGPATPELQSVYDAAFPG